MNINMALENNHSTDQALIELVEQIRVSADNNQITCGVFVDL